MTSKEPSATPASFPGSPSITVIHPGEQLTLSRPLTAGELVIHRGRIKPTTLNLAGHALHYTEISIMGHGRCEIRDGDLVLLSSDSDGDASLVLRKIQ